MNFLNVIKSSIWLIFAMDYSLAQLESESERSQLFIGEYPIPPKTEAPLNIETRKVKKKNLSPIRFRAWIAEDTQVINTGKAIEIIKTEDDFRITVTGGPLRNNIYKFHLTRIYWSGNTTGPAGTLVDGANGTPIEVVHYWYNQKYGSFENALNYRDGLAVFLFPVKIGPLPSITFILFSQKLKKVREPGSSVPAPLIDHFVWFDGYALPNIPYFSYPGSYTDQNTSKTYYCTTHIVYRPQINFISKIQFEKYFLTLKNFKGDRLINAVQTHPQGDIPVIEAIGQTQYFIIPLGERFGIPFFY